MLYSQRSYEQSVGENVSEVQNRGRMVRARGVAETQLYSFAAEPPGGPMATFASVTCTCTLRHTCEDHKVEYERRKPWTRKVPEFQPEPEPVDAPKFEKETEDERSLAPCSGTAIYAPDRSAEEFYNMSKEDVFAHTQIGHKRDPGLEPAPKVYGEYTSVPLAGSGKGPGGPCPCGEDHNAGETLGSFGVGPLYSGSERAPDISSHEVYCSCSDCHAPEEPDDSCPGCGKTCDDDFCFCPPTCAICDDNLDSIDLALEQFTFTITPDLLSPGDYLECFSPDMLTAFWDDGELTVADTQSDARWRVISCEEQTRGAGRQYYTWYCERIGVTNPCDEDFMKAISS